MGELLDKMNDFEIENDEKARALAVEIKEEPQNIMLSAAAGSGKTYTLVKRIVNHILKLPDDKHIDSFAVVTFTKAAAAELSEKICDELSFVISDKENKYSDLEKKRAYSESLLIQKAMIGTIDSFCLDVVEKNFAKLGISPKIAIEEGENAFINQVIDGVLEKRYGGKRTSTEFKSLSKLVDIFGSINDDDGLKEKLIVPVLNLMYTIPNPKAWTEKISSYYDEPTDFKNNIWYKKLKEIYEIYLRACIDHGERLERNLSEGVYELSEKVLASCLNCIDNDLYSLKNLQLSVKKDDEETPILFTDEIYLKLSDWPRTGCGSDAEKAEKDSVKKEREVYKDVIKSFSEDFFGKANEKDTKEKEEQFATGIKRISQYIRVVLDICIEVYDEALAISKQKNKYTFSQIAHLALSLLIEGEITNDGVEGLSATETAKAYRNKFEEIYIDEYQDTTLLQEYIMYIVSGIQDGKNNLFNVGDVKQSIYRFRNATPRLFLDKYALYKSNPEAGLLLTLSRNFRCRRGVIDGTNDIFEKIMTKEVSDIDYNDGHRLTFGAEKDYKDNPFPGGEESGKCELIICEKKSKKKENKEEDEEEKTTPTEYEIVAEKIAHLMENDFRIVEKATKNQRKIKYSDICILSSKNRILNDARKFLREIGLPCDAVSDNFFEREEVIDVLSFLRVVDNPHIDVEIAALMKSRFFGFTDTQLAKIAVERKKNGLKGDFYDAVKKLSKIEGELAKKLSDFLEEIKAIRDMSLKANVSQLVWYVIKYKDYYENCDEVGKGNLRLLQKEASPFDNGINGGLFSFLSSVDKKIKLSEKNPQMAMESYAPQGEIDDKIKFMTVHGSKGLEFPVVFIIGTAGSKNDNNSKGSSVDVTNGIGFSVDFGRKIEHSAPYNAIKEAEKIENLKEKQRLLYVGLTRAREKLFVIGTIGEKNFTLLKISKHTPIVSEMSLRTWTSFLDMIANSISESSSWKVELVPLGHEFSENDYKEKIEKFNLSEKHSQNEIDDNAVIKNEYTSSEEAERLFSDAVSCTDNGTLPLKLSVSALKHYSVDEDGNTNEISIHPNDIRELPEIEKQKEAGSGTAFGTLMHKAMRFLVQERDQFNKITDENADDFITSFVNRKVSENIFTKEDANIIDKSMIKKFLLSDIAKEIYGATDVRCEIPFTFMTDINKYINKEEIKKDLEQANNLAIQGVIDLYFKFNGRIVILDYKTDKIFTEESLSAYRLQLECYSDAIENISEEKVFKKILFHLRDGNSIEV